MPFVIFPSNNGVIKKEFILGIGYTDKTSITVQIWNLTHIIYKDTDHISPLKEIEPDHHFLSRIDNYLSQFNWYE